jgi:hypothetical protein
MICTKLQDKMNMRYWVATNNTSNFEVLSYYKQYFKHKQSSYVIYILSYDKKTKKQTMMRGCYPSNVSHLHTERERERERERREKKERGEWRERERVERREERGERP